jgi:GalNAc5-diNAcBac-PP-undecaprenol beta-1,3-glucosyltransferase
MEHVPLGADQKKILDGYSHYFCAIHSYLDGDRRQGLRHLSSAARQIGINKQVAALFAKMIVGQKLLHKAAGKINVGSS